MRNLLIAIVVLIGAQMALAHGDHPPRVVLCAKECTQDEIKGAVPRATEMLANSGRIENTWTYAKLEKIEKKDFKKGPEWVVTLSDEKQKDPKKQKLFIFITMRGYLNGANHTGE